MTTIGLVTIGQAPRDDVTPDIVAHLPDDVDVVEVGVLDAFDSAEAVEAELGPVDDRPIFVTRMRDGASVTIDRERVHERLADRITDMGDSVDVIGLLCTGFFPPMETAVPVLKPSDLLHAWVTGVAGPDDVVGVIMPKAEQAVQTREKWAGEHELVTAAGSPYEGGDEVRKAAESIGDAADLVVMDCIGYTPAMKATVKDVTGTSVLLARSVLAKTATELL